jgi:signal transduction histidine kinase
MSSPSQEPAQPLTVAQITQWIRIATEERLEIHLRATEPSSEARAQAFADMAALCKDAIEEVRVISTQLRAESEAACRQSAAIRADSLRILKILHSDQRDKSSV